MNNLKKKNLFYVVYNNILFILSIIFPLFFIYILGFYPLAPHIMRSIFLMFVSVFVIIFYPLNKKNKKNYFLFSIDFILILLSIISFSYIIFEGDMLLIRIGTIPNKWDIFFGTAIIIIVLEITRRCVGLALPLIGMIFYFFAFLGPFIPGYFGHGGYSFRRVSGYLMGMDGVLGLPTGVASTYVFLFIIFAAFLQGFGGGKFFIQLATSLFGRTRGGPAKIAILASSLFGTISGSAVANTVGTGSFTIPLMKSTGYNPVFSAAVEAVASTGGQLMPPIMGAGAFIIAEILGIPYLHVAAAAIIPALLFYIAVFTMVDLEAVKLGLVGIPKAKIPNFKEIILKEGYLLIPLFVLLYSLIILRTSPIRAAIFAIYSMIFIGFSMKIIKKKLNEFPNMLLDSLHQSSKNVLMAATTCACAGIVVGIISLTGVGVKIASLIVNLSATSILLGLISAMVVAVILGMGLPTTPAYIVGAAVVAPALIRSGLPPLPSHLFTFYFSCLAVITPPVAIASYAAAGIAGVKPTKVSFKAVKLGIVAFIVPYMFIYWPSLLGVGSIKEVLYSFITAVIGVIALSCCLQGRFLGRLNQIFLRIFLGVGALIMIIPGGITDFIGFSIFTTILILQMLKHKNNLIK